MEGEKEQNVYIRKGEPYAVKERLILIKVNENLLDKLKAFLCLQSIQFSHIGH